MEIQKAQEIKEMINNIQGMGGALASWAHNFKSTMFSVLTKNEKSEVDLTPAIVELVSLKFSIIEFIEELDETIDKEFPNKT